MEQDQQIPYSSNDVKEKMEEQIYQISRTFYLQKSDATVLLMHLGWDSLLVAKQFGGKREELFVESGLESVVFDSNLDVSNSFCGICSKTEEEFIEFDDDNDCGDNDGDGDGDVDGIGDGDSDGHGDGDGDEDEDQDEDQDEDEDDDDDDEDEDEDEDDDDDDEEYDDEYDRHHFISTPFCSHKFCKTCWREYLKKNFYSLEENLTVISCPNQDCGAAVGQNTIEKLGVHDQEMYESYLLRSYLEIKQLSALDCN